MIWQWVNLRLAGEWLLDSYLGKNELLSFVQAAVVMEILLGEKAKSDIIGIGELLHNRCAYLIGKSYNERKQNLEDFDRIYDVRSAIVHRGKTRLKYNERVLFKKLQWVFGRVIIEELNLLTENYKRAMTSVSDRKCQLPVRLPTCLDRRRCCIKKIIQYFL